MGHRPFRALTKHFTAEDRAYIEAGKARIHEEVKREKVEHEGREPAQREEGPSRPAASASG